MCGSPGLPPSASTTVSVVERDGAALQGRVADEDELTRAELVLVAVDREPRAAAEHEVDLLVAERAFGVLLDDRAPPASRACRR